MKSVGSRQRQYSKSVGGGRWTELKSAVKARLADHAVQSQKERYMERRTMLALPLAMLALFGTAGTGLAAEPEVSIYLNPN